MEELMFCEIIRKDVAAYYEERKKMEFTTTVTIRGVVHNPFEDEYLILFVEDNIDEGTAIIRKDSLGNESEWASFIGKSVQLQGFAIPPIKNGQPPKLFIYHLKEN